MANITKSLAKLCTIAGFSLFTVPVLAQEEAPKIDFSFNTRFELSGEKPKDGEGSAGFHGSFLNIMIKGELTKGLSYSWRQRLNKFQHISNDYFSATDWIYLTYKPTKNWAISGGKQIVAIGGWEYDAPPIDIYYSSLFWQNIPCYAFGVSGAYTSNNGKHTLLGQICNSPFSGSNLGSKQFGYNLMWTGHVGLWHPLWSVNLFDYNRGHYAQFVMLGNRFDLGPLTLDVDLLNRHYEGSHFFFKNWNLTCKADFKINSKANVFVKGGYDRFLDDALKPTVTSVVTNAAGEEVKVETPFFAEKPFVSAGLELRPVKKYPGIRLHAVYGLTTYDGEYQHNAMAGVTWNCNVFKR